MIAYENALIISDIHLTPAYPYTAKRFIEFCENEARSTQAVFIIGDLFEFWVGDDAHLHTPFHLDIAKHINLLVQSGVAVYFMAGNRDFMLGESFKSLANWQVIPDPSLITIAGEQWLLTHGDALCTADPAYQFYRRLTRLHWLQKLFMHIPIRYRKQMAERLRRRATIKYQRKQYFDQALANLKGDVTLDACAKLTKQQGCAKLIHGHTHRPKYHKESLANQQWQRWVLSDWDLDHPEMRPHASAFRLNASGLQVLNLA
jgi:UDP-2,3-diacylglucosamine hydrolase